MIFKPWLYLMVAVAAVVLAAYGYDLYVANVPHYVWRFAAIVWAAWSVWNFMRQLTN